MLRYTSLFLAILGVFLLAGSVCATAQIQVDSTNPRAAPQGTINLDVTISGNGFKKGAKAQWFVTGTTNPGGVTVNSTTFKGSTQLTANLKVAVDAVISGFDIVVTNTDGRTGLVTFASGQIFPGTGSGAITGVSAGIGLSGGGNSGNVTLTNSGVLSVAGGNVIASSGGQSPILSLNTNFTDSRYLQLSGGILSGNLSAIGFSGNGAALTSLNPANLSLGTANININGLAASATNALNLGGNPPNSYATTGANTFTGMQRVSGDVNATGTVSASTVNIGGPYINGLQGGLFTTGINIGTTGRATNMQGFPSYPLQFWSSSFNSSFGQPWLQSFQWVSEPTGNNTANPSATLNLQALNGPIIPPPPTGYSMQETGFSVGSSGQITIGGGTAIVRHASVLFQNVTFNTKMSPATCTVWSGPMGNLFDGDTVVVTMGSSLMTANIVYSAWATNGAVQVRICNPTGSPTTIGAGSIRVDLWRH